SAASFTGDELASESITAAFGQRLATGTKVADATPLPLSLLGTTVKVRDSAGSDRSAPLFFVGPAQINLQIPPGTATGPAQITTTSGDGTVSIGTVNIASVAPGLFAASADGKGVAAAVVLRIKSNGAQTFEAIARFDSGQNKFVPVAVDLGAATD